LIRAATIAKHLSYTLLLDSSSWNNGRFETYFVPPTLPCRPPTIKHRTVIKLTPSEIESGKGLDKGKGLPEWTKADHVVFKRNIDHLDQLFLNLFIDSSMLAKLNEEDSRRGKENTLRGNNEALYLTAKETLPPVYHQAFRMQADILSGLWKLNDNMLKLIDDFEDKLDWTHHDGDSIDSMKIGVHVR
jgi:hypothetical protein